MDNVTRIFNIFEYIDKHNITGILEKEKLIKSILNYPETKIIFNYLVNPNIKFGVSIDTLPSIHGHRQLAKFKHFVEISERVINGELTSRTKRLALMKAFLEQCDKLHAKWYRRIWLKKLRIGVSKKLMLAQIEFVKRTVMKAKPIDSVNTEQIFKHKWYIEPKIDGIRMITVITDDGIEFLSRNMKSLTSFVKYKFEKAFKNSSMKNIVIDGELFNVDWSKTASLRRNEIDKELLKSAKYYIFDIIPYDKFDKQERVNIPLKERKQKLKAFYKDLPYKKGLVLVPYKLVSTFDDAQKISDEFVKKGFEGAMIKDPDSPYEFKRSNFWLKIKPFKTGDFLCVGIIESKIHKGELQAIVIDINGVKTKVGSGFTYEQRKRFMKSPNLIVNKIVEVKYQDVTSKGVLRFPVFMRVRYDKHIPDVI